MLPGSVKKGGAMFLFVVMALLSGCGSLGAIRAHFMGIDAEGQMKEYAEGQMEEYAEARYEKAMRYMESGRFELAQEQFAIVASTTVSEELRRQALYGYEKIAKVMAVRR